MSSSNLATHRKPPPGYTPGNAVRTHLLASGSWRDKRLAAGDMGSVREVAARLGLSSPTVRQLVRTGNAIGISTPRGYRLPLWQCHPRIWPVLGALTSALGTSSGWAVLAFLETPLGALDGLPPREALERGDGPRVLTIAGHDTY